MSDLHDSLDQIKARAEMASDGPWEVYDANEGMFPPRPLWSVDNEASRNYEDYDEDDIWPAIDLHLDTGLKTDAEFIAHARTDVPRLVAAIEAVLELHYENFMGECHYCMSLADAEEAFEVIEWPCPTVRTLTDKLTEEESS